MIVLELWKNHFKAITLAHLNMTGRGILLKTFSPIFMKPLWSFGEQSASFFFFVIICIENWSEHAYIGQNVGLDFLYHKLLKLLAFFPDYCCLISKVTTDQLASKMGFLDYITEIIMSYWTGWIIWMDTSFMRNRSIFFLCSHGTK